MRPLDVERSLERPAAVRALFRAHKMLCETAVCLRARGKAKHFIKGSEVSFYRRIVVCADDRYSSFAAVFRKMIYLFYFARSHADRSFCSSSKCMDGRRTFVICEMIRRFCAARQCEKTYDKRCRQKSAHKAHE